MSDTASAEIAALQHQAATLSAAIVDNLASLQEADGEFRSYRTFRPGARRYGEPSEFDGWFYFGKCPFFTATIAYHLRDFGTPAAAIRDKACRFLLGCVEAHGQVRYVPARYQDVWFPPDVDDTCVVNAALRDCGFPAAGSPLLALSRRRKGGYYTWTFPRLQYLANPAGFVWILKDFLAYATRALGQDWKNGLRLLAEYRGAHEPAVDANVRLWLLDDEAGDLDQAIAAALAQPSVRLEYYDSELEVYFHAGRLVERGVTALAAFGDKIERYIVGRQASEGSVGTRLETAMAALTLMYYRREHPVLHRALGALCRDVARSEAWVPLPYCGNKDVSDGAPALTAALVADALRMYAERPSPGLAT